MEICRARKMKGYPFRRQRPVLKYIADFMCKELKLIIEVDGITHQYQGAQERDAARQNVLGKAGFTVLRFEDAEVLNDINFVYTEIENWIESQEIKPLPNPRQRGTPKIDN